MSGTQGYRGPVDMAPTRQGYPVLLPTTYETFELYYEYKTKTYVRLRPSVAQPRVKDNSLVHVESPKPNSLRAATINPKKRSRGGCLTCRQRKKRCCEQKPRCTECDRLDIRCEWPVPGRERKNRNKQYELQHDEIFHEVYGVIKVLRGVVQYRIGDIDKHEQELKLQEAQQAEQNLAA